jgi:hypothetical protein
MAEIKENLRYLQVFLRYSRNTVAEILKKGQEELTILLRRGTL